MTNPRFKFIDLFAGIGGFHQAMSKLGGQCVFAAEIDDSAIDVYKKNYGMDSRNDITQIDPYDVPDHDILCMGFPCQAFSKGGKQEGFKDDRGNLFFHAAKIIEAKKPKYILLENVKNLVGHDNGNTWNVIYTTLDELGYHVPQQPPIISPIHFGIPQLRDRVIIPCVRKDYRAKHIEIPKLTKRTADIYSVLDSEVDSKYNISEYENKVLELWDSFIKCVKVKPTFPIWLDYLNFEHTDISDLPSWKRDIILKNRLYLIANPTISGWLEGNAEFIKQLTPTHRKFEWQAGGSYHSVFDCLIQFRPSGVRVKQPTAYPALVAIVQTPIVGKYRRKLTPRECARLQSFPEDFIMASEDAKAYKQFGNAVNVDVIKFVGEIIVGDMEGSDENLV